MSDVHAVPAPTWVRWPFRISITAGVVLLADQAVFAGQFLSGSFVALHLHRENATVAGIVVFVAAVAAVPLRWPGGGPWWPAVACLVLLALVAAQIALGFARVLTVHIPLGVLIIAGAGWLAVWSWRAPTSERP
jgi:hypothetical protein